MACIKGVSRSASVAIAPDAPYLVAGTMAGAVDPSFSSTANVEIFKLDFQSDDQDLPVAGGCTTTERFNRLSWGKNVSGSEEFLLGLIAGSFVDGTIGLWNPLNLIRANSGETAFVGNLSKHKGAVRGLEFNAITPNLLASGADEGEICIWDLAKPTDPSHFPPLKGSGSTAQGEISYLSWNSKVQHILASTSFNGKTVVWDLKKQKPVISFSDSTRARCSVLQWNPDVVTQLVVACDDDNSPSLKLWDMRNTMTPVMEFVGHTKGVIAMSWCPTDSSYLLTCAKDNRTICWDTSTAEIVCELPTGTNWNFDVHWYPKIPGVITASSFDGKIGIYNIEGCSRYGAGEIDFCAAPLRAPKWYRRPSGATFGFGGKLVFFHSKSSAAGINAVLSEVHVHDLVAEHGLVSRSTEFESAMKNGERSSLRILCDKKAHASETGDEKETWMFLKVMFEEEGNARTKLLTHLGFSAPVEEDSETDVSQHVRSLNAESCDSVVAAGSTSAFLTDNGEDFFNNLPSPKADTPLSVSNRTTFGVEERSTFSEDACDDVDACESSFEEGIRRALAVGDYRGAVQQCVAVNKMADALVIAHLGGTSLWEQTREQYLKMSPPSYLQVVSSMVNNDLMNLVKTRPLRLWKEVLGLLCTFAHGEEWAVLCDTLALRLMNAGSVLAATLCFICAGNIDSTVGIWSQSLARGQMGRSYVDQLQDLMEKTIVLALATGQKRFSGSLNKLVEKYVEILVSQGLLTTAMEYLNLLGSESTSPELAILRDRIAASTLLPVKGVVEPVDHPPTVETSQGYYQEAVQQQQAVVPGGPYGENYQHSLSSPVYGSRGYMSASVPYQQQPHMFMPAHVPVVPPGNFTPLPATTQPAVRPFVPATPPVLKNAEQYQQPMTLGSQLFPGGGAAYHPPPASGPAVPPPSSMVPSLRGSGVVQRPAHPPQQQQPPSPTSAAAQPPTVQTADTSSVRPQLRPVVATLTKLYLETSDAMGGPRAVPAKKREIDDNSKKIGALFAKLNTGDISDNASARLVHLCLALDAADYAAALQTQVLLTTSEWDECNFWLAALKRMIRTRQSIRLN